MGVFGWMEGKIRDEGREEKGNKERKNGVEGKGFMEIGRGFDGVGVGLKVG